MQDDIGLIDGVILGDRLLLLASSAQLEAEEVEHVFILDRKEGAWKVWEEELEAIRIVSTGGGIAIMSQFGPVLFVDSSGSVLEDIDDGQDGPSDLRPLNDLAVIGKALYAVGMRRQIYRRLLSSGPWARNDAGVFVPISEETNRGILAIGGFSEDEIYAVGFEGEVWLYHGKEWRAVDSPTNVRLEAISCNSSGEVVLAGEAGLILIGRRDAWEIIDHDETETVLVAACEFSGKTYLASEDEGMFVLGPERVLEKVNLDHHEQLGIARLKSDGSKLLAVGEEGALVFDGDIWERLALPDIPGFE